MDRAWSGNSRVCIVCRWKIMGMSNGDIIEVRIYDNTYRIFFKGKARLKDKKQMQELLEDLNSKGINISSNKVGWFD